MKPVRTMICAVALSAFLLNAGLGSGNTAPSIQGHYMLEYRELPDGKKVRSPEVIGMMTYTKSMRNLNVYWTENGKPTSVSIISNYTLNDKEYTEESLYKAANEAGKGIAYQTDPTQGRSPVTMKDGKINFKLPLYGEPEVSFDANGFTATRQGAFVDHWKKMD